MQKTAFRVMRLLVVFIFVASFAVSARPAAQTVSFSGSNVPLSQVLSIVEKQTGYLVFFALDALESARPVSLSVRNMPLTDFMTVLLKDQPLQFRIDGETIFLSEKALTSSKRWPDLSDVISTLRPPLKGRVRDNSGTSISNVTVSIKGKSTIVMSDSAGHFSIEVKPGDVIQFSHISYSSAAHTVKENDFNKTITITLEPVVASLNSVEVNTGYQRLPKERATGSFSHIDNKLFNQQVGTTILDRLETIGNGIVVDRTYGSKPTIMVRGLSTIQGPREVLVVVDNFPYEGDINNINPNNVESITILKDAAAASIWGARAGNGVIVVITKKGRYDQPMNINLNANVTIGAKPDLYKATQVSSAGFVEYEKFLYGKGYYNSKINRIPSVDILSPVVELLILRDKATTETEKALIDQQIESYKNLDIRNDMMKYLYRNMVNQQYALDLQGGTKNFAWTVSANYDDNKNNLHARYSRKNLQYRQAFRPLSNLEINTSLYFTQSLNKSGAKGYGEVTTISNGFFPYTRLVDDQGNAIGITKALRSAWTDTILAGKMLDWKYYPLTDWKYSTQSTKSNDILVNTGINYRIIPSLTIDFKYQYEKQLQESITLDGIESWTTRYYINLYSEQNPDGSIKYGYPYGGKYQFTYRDLESHQFRGQLNLNQRIGEDHEIVAIAGTEVRMLNKKSNGGGMYGFDEELLTFHSNFDHTKTYPSLTGGSSQFGNLMSSPQHTTTHFLSMFGNASYSYRERYTVSVSARTDASNLFGLKINDQWNPFYSVGLSWNLAKEDFYRFSFLPGLKLRATYGVSGNIDPAMVAVTTMQYNYGSTSFGTPYGMLQNFYNPELRWETAKQFNIGTDFNTQNQILQGSIEYFHKRGTNLFGNALLDYTAGVGNSITKNVSSMKGNGVDIELNARIIDQAFKWRSKINYSWYKDEIVDYLLSSTNGYSYVARGGEIKQGKPTKVGKPVNSVFSFRWGGLDPETGDPIGYLNGEKSKNYAAIYLNTSIDELVFHGSSIPTHYGNWINTFSYKDFELNVGLNYKLGYYFRRETIDYEALAWQALGHSDFDKRWQKPGDELRTNIPSISYPNDTYRHNVYSYSSVMVEKGDHVRLQYLQLNYMLQRNRIPSLPFRTARIYINANNLGILWRANNEGIDPDRTERYSNYSVPGSHSISIGININF